MSKAVPVDGVVEAVFPEVDSYPAYRAPAPVVVTRRVAKPETMIERYVAAAAAATGTLLLS